MVFTTILDGYHRVLNKADPQMDRFLLMRSPIPTVIMCLSYVYFVKYLGPKLMENRRPLQLRRLMLFYNVLTVLVNGLFAYGGLMYYFYFGASLQCDLLESHKFDLIREGAIVLSYGYYLLKLAEFMDTIFAVLRKKQSQVSNLHVLHHGILPFSVWLGIKFVPASHGIFFGWINSIVHVVMYTYYALASLGPAVQKHLWWKPYLTQLQLVHFVAIILHQSQVFFNGCGYPKLLSAWIIVHAAMFFILFLNFYQETYKSKVDTDKITHNGLRSSTKAE